MLLLSDALAPGRMEADGNVHRLGRAESPDETLQLLGQAALNLHAAHRYDLVQGFFAVPAGYVAAFAAKMAGVPSVVSLRGNDLDRAMFHGPRLPMLLWTLSNATALTGVSAEILAKASALSGRTSGHHVVPNAVDATVFAPGEAATFEAPRPWFGFAGELRFKKGQDLLDDLATLTKGTVFAIGGVREDSRRPSTLRELPYERDPAKLARIYRAMNLVVFPSLWDGLPNALLEAMACARPVLATRVGAFPEVIEHGKTGFLAASHDAFAREAGRAAREKVVRDHAPARELETLMRVYEDLLRRQ